MRRHFVFLLFCSYFLCLQAQTTQITIDPSYSYQTINSFSASDCWTANFVGNYWEESKKELIAKYLFSQNLKSDGSPDGIGLSMWRVNLGAGTAEQGDDSDIGDLSRRAECFLDETGNYDWTKQAGQQYFIKKAKEYGCDNFVAFSNSPLTIYTRNGKGYAIGDGNSNLQSDKYDDYAEYLATVLEHFKDEKIPFSYISPVNEPQYDWAGNPPGQEGTPWQNSEIKKLVVELDKSINKRNLDTKILLAEAGSWEYLYKNNGRASNQIYDFFHKTSENYLGDLTSMADVIGAHSYWTHWDDQTIKNVRYDAKTTARKYGLGIFQTEWSMLSGASSSTGFVEDMEAASHMDFALFMAKIIHSDLSFAEVSSWSYWTAMDMERWNHKNRFLLIALEPGGNAYHPITTSGNVVPRSTLWALGNYSFFIKPGYKRIRISGPDEISGLLGTAYLAPDQSRAVAVYINMHYEAKDIQTEFINTDKTILTNKRYITSAVYDLKKHGSPASESYSPDRVISVPARSVMTVVYDMADNNSIEETSGFKFNVSPNLVRVGEPIQIQLEDHNIFESTNILISSLDGKVVYRQQMPDSQDILQMTIPNVISGTYLITIENHKNIYHQKLIIRE